MNKNKWLALLNENWIELREVIAKYHPVYKNTLGHYEPITATRVERVSVKIRQDIEEKYLFTERPDILKMKKDGDCDSLITILNETWFGIPESRYEVVKIGPVFSVLCTLCEGYEQ